MPSNFIRKARLPLLVKIILFTGIPFVLTVCLIFAINFKQYADSSFENLLLDAERLSDTTRFGISSAMMADSKEDVQATIQNVGRLEGVMDVRIYSMRGVIRFSDDPKEIGSAITSESRDCAVCHSKKPVPTSLGRRERMTVLENSDEKRILSILSPIANAPGCSSTACHAHRENQKPLGLLAMTISLERADAELMQFVLINITSLFVTVLVLIGLVYAALHRLVLFPVRSMIAGIEKIRVGERVPFGAMEQNDELGQLASAIGELGEEVRAKHAELREQREIYWRLFDAAPCMITVQNKNYELIRYNKYFAEHFPVEEGMHCYEVYKKQAWKCENCPTEKAFETGRPHFSEESGFYKDGTRAHWIVNASPIFDAEGNVVAAMSASLDITARKKLEEELKKTEKKYFDIFNNIPYALFLVNRGTLVITDCNRSAAVLYGYTKGQMIGKSFLDFFTETDRSAYVSAIESLAPINRARHSTRDGGVLYVNINLSDSEYQVGGKVVLATVIDITERIEAEQQVIQANKMATLGEMATGVAHELNQPLSVIQMISNLFARNLDRGAVPDKDTLSDISSKLRSNVERASKIINHMREFGRKSTLEAGSVQLNEVILKSLDFFSQQLRLRDIEVVLELGEDLPMIKADPNRLEQVFVNLLTNARDAIEEKSLREPLSNGEKKITIQTRCNRRYVFAEICDTGVGIPKEVQHRLFEPFFTTKDVGRGTGLGLSISYRIVTDYAGTIHAISKEGGGACFDIRFPREVAA